MLSNLAHRLGWTPAWCRDLCEYYGVTPSQALQLGTREKGRRPSLPGSPTCEPVSGKTWEELWEQYPRDSEEAIFAFWKEVGSWCVFRQVVRNRRRSFGFIGKRLGMNDAFCEYGAGVAPASWWLLTHHPVPLRLTLVDVPSEHLTFGTWRLLRRRLEREWGLHCWSLRVAVLMPKVWPLTEKYQGIACLEVLEHVPKPLELMWHLLESLERGGYLWEDFVRHDDAHGADLPEAQQQRLAVYHMLGNTCNLLEGRLWTESDGGGTRTWQKR